MRYIFLFLFSYFLFFISLPGFSFSFLYYLFIFLYYFFILFLILLYDPVRLRHLFFWPCKPPTFWNKFLCNGGGFWIFLNFHYNFYFFLFNTFALYPFNFFSPFDRPAPYLTLNHLFTIQHPRFFNSFLYYFLFFFFYYLLFYTFSLHLILYFLSYIQHPVIFYSFLY